MKNWAKTITSVYRYLEPISNSIDNLVLKRSVNSAFYNDWKGGSVQNYTDNIIDLIERKKRLINLKVIFDTNINELPLEYKKILVLSYIDNVSTNDLCEVMNVSPRTMFRKKSISLDMLNKTLIKNGYTKEYFETHYNQDIWLNTFHNNVNQLSSEVTISTNKMLKTVMREFNQSPRLLAN